MLTHSSLKKLNIAMTSDRMGTKGSKWYWVGIWLN